RIFALACCRVDEPATSAELSGIRRPGGQLGGLPVDPLAVLTQSLIRLLDLADGPSCLAHAHYPPHNRPRREVPRPPPGQTLENRSSCTGEPPRGHPPSRRAGAPRSRRRRLLIGT